MDGDGAVNGAKRGTAQRMIMLFVRCSAEKGISRRGHTQKPFSLISFYSHPPPLACGPSLADALTKKMSFLVLRI